jgi:two-component system, OmpR family, alkaline phosphatase synthesis response regulator PhoP
MRDKDKILIIDDEGDLRIALRSALTDAGFEVIEAVNGKDGLVKAREDEPDLILLDLTMPHMNGHQVLRELKAHPTRNNPHILIFTNSDDAANITRGVALKGDDYIMKSQTSLSDIVKRVKQRLAGYYDHT